MAKREEFSQGLNLSEGKEAAASSVAERLAVSIETAQPISPTTIRLAQADQNQQDTLPETFDVTTAPVSAVFTSNEFGQEIILPEGIDISRVLVLNGNLYLVQPDGSVVIIVNGAVNYPNLVVNAEQGIVIPAENLKVALENLVEGQVAAGPEAGPGGPEGTGSADFAVDQGGIGDGVPLINLLPLTVLNFELFPVEDREFLFVQEQEIALTPTPPTIGEPERGAVEEDDLGTLFAIIQPNGLSKIGNDLFPDASFGSALMFTGNLDVTGATTVEFTDLGATSIPLLDANGNPVTAGGDPVLISRVDLSGSADPAKLVGFVDAGTANGVYDPGTDHLIFDVMITPDGSGGFEYKITVHCSIDHSDPVHNGTDGDAVPGPTGENDEELLPLQFDFTATNPDGTISSTFIVDWQDDMPVIGIPVPPGEEETPVWTLELTTPHEFVDEDPDLPSSENPGGPQGIEGGPGDLTDPAGLTVSGDLNILWGADNANDNSGNIPGDRMIVLTGLTVTDELGNIIYDGSTNNLMALVPSAGAGTPLEQVLVTISITTDANNQSVLTGTATASDDMVYTVFEVTTDDSGSGSFEYTLNHPLVHQFTDPDLLNNGPETAYEDNLIFTFDFNAKDSDGDTVAGQFIVEADDDSPAFNESGGLFVTDMVTHDETEGLQDGTEPADNTGSDDDVAGSDLISGGSGPTVASLFDSVINVGSDPHVANKDESGANDAIGYARSNNALAQFFGVEFGADGPFGGTTAPGSGAITYALTLGGGTGPVATSLQTTEGEAISLFLENGVVVGRFDGNDAGSDITGDDPAAFAIAIDPDTGEVFLAQYVSLFNNSPGDGTAGTHDEPVSLDGTPLAVEVTFKDGDEDALVDSVNIGSAVKFEDDGPAISVTVDDDDLGELMVGLDESIIDPQTSSEDEPGNFAAGSDDIPVASGGITQVNGTDPIGMQMTSSGDISGLFDIVEDPGSDGKKDREDSYTLTLTDADGNTVAQDPGTFLVTNGVATTLEVTDFATDGNPDLNAGNPYADKVIYLFLVDSTHIEGRIDADGNGTADDIAFTVELDLATFGSEDPKLIVSQIFAIDHPDSPDNFDEQEILGIAGTDVDASAGIGVKLESTLFDNDDDEASGEATANITGAIKFEDDGPAEISIEVDDDALSELMVGLDESIIDPQTSSENEPGNFAAGSDDIPVASGGITQVNGTDPIGMQMTSSGDISGLFDFTTDAGTDGEKDRQDSYTLTLTDADGNTVAQDPGTFLVTNGVATTLEVTDFATDGNPDLNAGNPYADKVIYLFLVDSTHIEGRIDADGNGTADDIAFTVELDLATFGSEDPKLIVSQIFAIDHPDSPDNFDEQEILGIAGTDVDASAGIGVTVQSTLIDGDDDELESEEATANITGAIKFEDDGPLLLDVDPVMGVVEEEHLNNFDPDYVGPGIEGSSGNEDEDDVNNLDGDVDPNFNITTNVFSGTGATSLANLVDFGTDGGKFVAKNVVGTDAALVKDSDGNTVTSKGSDVSFTDFDDTTPGETTLTATSSDGRTIFTLTIFEDGNWTLTLLDQIDHHPLPIAADDAENIRVLDLGAVVNAIDGDNDTIMLAAGTFVVKVIDDIPVAGTAQEMFLANSLDNTATGDLNFSIGADEPGTLTLTKALDAGGGQTTLAEGNGVYGRVEGVVSQMTSEGTNLVWHQNSGSLDQASYPDGSWSAVLEGTTGTQSDFEAAIVFTVTVNADGTYTVLLDNPLPLDGVESTFELNFTGGGVSGGNSDQLIFFDSTEPDNNTEGTMDGNPDGIPDGSTIMAVAVGYLEDGTIDTVNSSTPGMGVDDGNTIDTDGTNSEQLRLFFGEPADPADIDGSLNDGFSLGTEGATNETDFIEKPLGFVRLTFDQLNGDGNTDVLGSGDEFALVGVVIEGAGAEGVGDVIWFKVEGEGTGASTDETLTIRQGTNGVGTLSGTGTKPDPYIVDMSFVDGVWTGTVEVDGQFATLLFEADPNNPQSPSGDGSSYRVVSAEGVGGSEGFDVDTTFTAAAEDADGDAAETTFDVNFISGTVLTGTAGSDVLKGNDDAETLSGGAGFDVLTGGADADTFVFKEGDGGTDQAQADIITDYEDGIDTIEIQNNSGLTFTSLTITDVSGDAVISITGTGEIIAVVQGVSSAVFDASDFVFTADPIVLDLGEAGISFTSLSDPVTFDLDGDGLAEQVAWTTGEDGFLVMDLDGSGAIEDGTELLSPFFGGGSFSSSLDALASLDDNGDGVIDSNDAAYADLQVWVDDNHDGVSQEGELKSLLDHGIESIDLNAQSVDAYVNDQHVFASGQFTLANGETRDYFGVDLDTAAVDASPIVAKRQVDASFSGNQYVFAFIAAAFALESITSITIGRSAEAGPIDPAQIVVSVSHGDGAAAVEAGSVTVSEDGTEVTVTLPEGVVIEGEEVTIEVGAGEGNPIPSSGGNFAVDFDDGIASLNGFFPSETETGDEDGPIVVSVEEEVVVGQTITGTDGDDVLIGTDGDDIIFGGLGDDTIDGGAGNDTIDGGPGQNTLTGGEGADTFVLGHIDIADVITDYDYDEGDEIDLSGLLGDSGASAEAGNLDSFVRVVAQVNGENEGASLEVDISGGGNDFAQVAQLQGIGVGDTVKIIIDDSGSGSGGDIVV